MNKETFGKFIAGTRRETGLTQQMLADRLHVTDKAVSKWERGLSYPDLTLLESLAEALGLTVTELMACRKNAEEAVPPDDGADNVRSLLDIANESNRRQKKKMWLSVIAFLLAAVLLAGLVYFCTLTSVHDSGYAIFVGKKANAAGNFVYIERQNRLIRLRCQDQQTFDSIQADDNVTYIIEYTWNRITNKGTLEYCEEGNGGILGGPMDTVGASIGVDNLLGHRFTVRRTMNAYPDWEGGYLFSYSYFYVGDGNAYYLGQDLPRTQITAVDDCRSTVAKDYDEDGIVELFVLTKYEEEPYMLYDLEEGEVVFSFVDAVPPDVLEALLDGAIW